MNTKKSQHHDVPVKIHAAFVRAGYYLEALDSTASKIAAKHVRRDISRAFKGITKPLDVRLLQHRSKMPNFGILERLKESEMDLYFQ